jgi:hypothetical protein
MSVPLAVVLALVAAAVLDLLKDEVRGQIERIPYAVLRVARLRLPAELRRRLYDGEWRPELDHIWTRLERVPLTRLIVGTRFALGLARVAPAVARELGVPRSRRVPLPLLLIAGGLGALLGLATTLGVFGALLGAVLSLAGGLAVVVIVFLVMDSIARDLGRRREPWA